MIVTVSKGQQITIPANIRNELGLDVGSKVEITKKDTKIIITPIGNDLDQVFEETKNIKPKFKLTAEQMDEINERMFK